MKIKKVMAGIMTAVICSTASFTPQTVEALEVTMQNHSIRCICESVNIPNGATVNATYTADDWTNTNGELSLMVTVPDTVSEACFGGICTTNSKHYTIQQGGCSITLSPTENADVSLLYYRIDNTDIIPQHKFSICCDNWSTDDALYLGDYCYTVNYIDSSNMAIRAMPTQGETSLGNVLWNALSSNTQTQPDMPQIEPVIEEETLPNPTLQWPVEDNVQETASRKDAIPVLETTVATTEPEPVAVTESTEPAETLPNPTLPSAYYETTIEPTIVVSPLQYNADWMTPITLTALKNNRHDYCWDWDDRKMLGDADCNGSVTMVDAVTIARFLTDGAYMPIGGIMNTDFNESGAPDLEDAVNLMRYVYGDITAQQLRATSPYAMHRFD